MARKTNIEVTKETWRELNQMKEGPGESFDTVINRLLNNMEAKQ